MEDKFVTIRKGLRCPKCGSALKSWTTKKTTKYKCYSCNRMVRPADGVEDLISTTARSKRRGLKDVTHVREWMDREKLLEVLYGIEDARHQAWIALVYLTGSRVSELCTYAKKATKELKPTKFPGLKKYQFEQVTDKEGRQWLKIRGVRVLKGRKGFKYITKVISYDLDGDFLLFIDHYLAQCEHDEVLFPFSRNYAYLIVNHYTGLFPHALRDMRVPDLRTIYGWGDAERVRYMGWTDRNMLDHYEQIDVQELMEQTKFN